MRLEYLYHWSPRSRRSAILLEGLKCGAPPTFCTRKTGYLCFSLNPHTAWELSAGTSGAALLPQEWDLWQATLSDTDQVAIYPCWGGNIQEVRLNNNVPSDRLFLAGTKRNTTLT
jgi:hypothetical protein